MSSYLKLFKDFLQMKESDGNRPPLSEEDATTAAEEQSTDSTNNTNNNSINITAGGSANKMEHSYTRDTIRVGSDITGLTPARTILVRRPPQCPSCHTHPLEEHDMEDSNKVEVPTYNEIAAKEAMNECARIAKYVKNANPDDDDWETRVNQIGWTKMQQKFFARVVYILDNDQLGRLANTGRVNEAMQRRVLVDQSSSRMRKALASVSWDSRLTQWLHCLLMDCLPASYMASYLDILQTLKTKLPALMDKMLFGRPMNISQELLAPVLKKQWQPMINNKVRKLNQPCVFVALPSMPTCGTVPNRLQKWYTQLGAISQLVQVTLPMTSGHTARQPLDQISEQIVSLTRVKVQELRNENPSRSIVLVGFNAGSCMALQVALSESIACVVCMSFAFNTFNGVRGAPDDRILDIKIPILFVIGQNSARTSHEEIESLREKMQSETSLVIVGCADDTLCVPKSRRKIENVTQAMVDSMVVDEVFDFVSKTLTNPPGPRSSVLINNVIYPKQCKSGSLTTGNDGSAHKATPVQRKRKLDGGAEGEAPAPKAKYAPHVGRPRTRPLNATSGTSAKSTAQKVGSCTAGPGVTKIQQKTQLSANTTLNDDLNMAIQTILNDSNEQESQSTGISTEPTQQKIMTNFELVPQSKTSPIKTTLMSPLKKPSIVGSGITTNTSTPLGTKIKMIPSNQFVQLKPPLQSQSKIYTIKPSQTNCSMVGSTGTTSTSIGSIVTTTPNLINTGQQQIFTLKSPNGQTKQFVTAAPPAAQQKYTVVKNAAGGTTLQLTSNNNKNLIAGSNLDLSNIIDMPIIFADNDGNLTDAVNADKPQILGTTIKPSTSTGVGQLIISQKIIKEATVSNPNTSQAANNNYIINKPIVGSNLLQQTQQSNKPNKVVFINRNTMKPCPSIITNSNITQLPKYTKVVVTNPKTSATTLVPRAGGVINGVATAGISNAGIITAVKQINLQQLKAGTVLTSGRQSGILNVSTKSLPQIQIINTNASIANSTATTFGTSGAITAPSQIRNIVLKPAGLKQLPPHLKSQFFNRNLTVRKLVNIVPAVKATVSAPSNIAAIASETAGAVADANTSSALGTITTAAAVANITTSPTTSSSSAIQTSPKIITLNPINPSTIVAAGTTVTAQPKQSE